MRLHNFIEKIQQYFKQSGEKPPTEFRALLEIYPKLVHFGFGDISNVSKDELGGLIAYSKELLRHNIFDAPYSECVLSWRSFMGGVLDEVVVCTAGPILPGEKSPEFFLMWAFARYQDKPNEYYGSYTRVKNALPEDDDKNFPKERLSLWHTPVINLYTGKQVGAESVTGFTHSMGMFIVLTSLLHSKGIIQKEVTAPKFINRKRAKQGKLHIPPLREVYIKLGGRVYRPSGEDTAGAHASPRCHWRRGHVRRLASGELTNVRPCLVGYVGGPEPEKRDYKIKM